MKIATTGFQGHVGSTLLKHGVLPLECDITNLDDVRKALDDVLPDIVINAAGKSDVDWCEKKENQDKVIMTNVRGAYYLSYAAEERNVPVIVLSTDHIFDGKKGPYKETEIKLKPVNYYGVSKLGMEAVALAFKNVKIVRTSNLFWLKDKRVRQYTDSLVPVQVPTFQFRSFMHINHFAISLLKFAEKFDSMPQILNISGKITTDWRTFVKDFARARGLPTDIFLEKRNDEKHYVPRPQKAGLVTALSARLGFEQYSYLDGLEELKNE